MGVQENRSNLIWTRSRIEMNRNASFILLVTLVLFIVDSEATPKQSRKIEELTRINRELIRKTEELKGKLKNCRDDNLALNKIKKLKEKLRTSESAYNALHTEYLEAGEKWIFENFPGTGLGCNTVTPRKVKKISLKGRKSNASTWKRLKDPIDNMLTLTWNVDGASRKLLGGARDKVDEWISSIILTEYKVNLVQAEDADIPIFFVDRPKYASLNDNAKSIAFSAIDQLEDPTPKAPVYVNMNPLGAMWLFHDKDSYLMVWNQTSLSHMKWYLTHEILHSLGMDHDENEPNSIMHSTNTPGNTAIFNDVFREFNTTKFMYQDKLRLKWLFTETKKPSIVRKNWNDMMVEEHPECKEWVKGDVNDNNVEPTVKTSTKPTRAMTSQYLMYTMYNSQTVFSYTLDVDRDPVKDGQYTIPYSTDWPAIIFNSQLSCLEVIGDWYSSSNKNHKLMTITGIFSNATDSLFHGDDHFEVVHSANVGTLVFSGVGLTQVYIMTKNSNWDKIKNSDKYLSPFQNPGTGSNYYEYGVVEHEDRVYLVGGYSSGYQNTIQVINFQNVDNLQTAQTRQWIFIENLKNYVNNPAMIVREEKLLIVGRIGVSTTCKDVQYLNLASNLTGVYGGTIDCGKYDGYYNPGVYDIVGGDVSIFGGFGAEESCIQQTASGDNLGIKWKCVPSSKSAFEGLGYKDDGSSKYIRYSNFVLQIVET